MTLGKKKNKLILEHEDKQQLSQNSDEAQVYK